MAWPYSQAAQLREDVLRKYCNPKFVEEIKICDCVIANLEMLENIISIFDHAASFEIKLYDTLPYLAIYRAGNYILAAPFFHSSLAVNTFQFELKLDASNQLIVQTLQNNFALIWQVARRFNRDPN